MRSALQFPQVCSPSPTKWSNRARFCCMALWSLLALSDQYCAATECPVLGCAFNRSVQHRL